MRAPLWKTLLFVAAGCAAGVGVGICCARQDESAVEDDAVESPRDSSASGKHQPEEPDAAPWLRINGAPPTRTHYCLFFGAWGGLIGVLLAIGGNPAVAIPVGIVGGLLGLFIERAAVGLMVERGFSHAHDPSYALVFFIAFASATAAAHYSSFRNNKKPQRRLREPE